jgi:ABC-2 type transport system permease protein
VWRTLIAVARKELLQLRRDSNIVRALALAQALDIASIAWIDTSVRNLPLTIVDQDHTSESRELVERLVSTGTFQVNYVTSSAEQARGHIRAGHSKVAVVIPPDYGRLRAAGGNAHFLALVDGSDSLSSEQATASIDGVTAQLNSELMAENAQDTNGATGRIEALSVPLFNPSSSTALFMLPGLLALLLFSYYADRAVSVAIEREEGHLERLLMTPMNYTGFILGKLVPYFFVAMINGLAYVAMMRWAFDVPIRGSVLLLLGALTLYVLTFLSLCSVIAAGAKSENDAFLKLTVFLLPSEMLSGYFFPLSALPAWLRPVSYALPQTHFIEIMRGICLRGAGVADLAPHLLFLAVAPIILLTLATWQFSRSVMID